MDGVSLEESLREIDQSLFQQFREKTSDIDCEELKENQFVGRWLKARSWDVDKAEKMFRTYYQWSRDVKLDEILTTFSVPEVIGKYFPGGMCGQDRFGRPAYICPAGTADVFGLMRSASRWQLATSQYYLMQQIIHEVLPAQSALMRRPVDQLVIIFDLQHMNRKQLWRPWVNFVLEMTSIFEVNFPELMAVCYVLNAPSFFSMLFALIKPLLSKETQDKIHILGSNYLDDLLKLFDPEGLPAHYGGSLTDPDGDPKCSSRVCWGGTVPESFYQTPQHPANSSTNPDEDLAANGSYDSYLLVPVGRGSKEYFYIGEAKATATITWEFFTESNDIAFSLWLEDPCTLSPEGSRQKTGLASSFSFNNLLSSEKSNKVWKQVTQPLRVDCDLVPETGSREVGVDGNYYLLFDNSYSWTRTKRVWCKTEIVSPDASPPPAVAAVAENQEAGVQDDLREVEDGLSEVCRTVCSSTYQQVSVSTLDVDVSALVMILLKTIPIVRSHKRSCDDADHV